MNTMNASVIMKQTPMVVAVATKYWNANCKTCIHFQKYKHPLQELHYKNSSVGECVKMKRMIFNEVKPVCKSILYEEK